MNVLDLFSGIGGFSLGLERAGMRTVAFCEIDPYCRAVLRKHWPAVPVFGDIRAVNAAALGDATTIRRYGHPPVSRSSGESQEEGGLCELVRAGIDLICGGFPCQDISVAGKGAGIDGARSGLWSEFARLIGEIRPRYVIVENVSALLGRGIERVLGDLAALGFDAEWHCIPASAVGAPHRRDRVWIVAYAESQRCGEAREHSKRYPFGIAGSCDALADTAEPRHADKPKEVRELEGRRLVIDCKRDDAWFTEPDVGRVANGIPSRVDRLRSLGNAVVPQVVEVIGRAIMSAEAAA